MIDVSIESEDKENPNFFILYKESDDDILDLANVNDDNYFLEPLINDYLNDWVKIVCFLLIPFIALSYYNSFWYIGNFFLRCHAIHCLPDW